jgi:hypothetical protein
MYDYFLERVEADLIAEEIAVLQVNVSSESNRLKEQNGQIAASKKEQEEKQGIRDDLRTELASDKDFIAKDEQEKKLR